MYTRHAVIVTVAALLVAAAGVTGLLAPALGAAGTAQASGGPAGGQAQVDAQAQANGTQGTATCDYAALYNQTIDSVVAVQTTSGQGSGFVYQTSDANASSYVVTNAHVVQGASEVTVDFARGESRIGTVVGRDAYADLAVVRVSDTPGYVGALSVAESPPDPGEKVAAIGNPLGFEETITHGIVSGVNRSMPTDQGFTIPDVIQTDAPINPGNSGGPLVTCDGTVVGVNTAGISGAQVENIGFAVSSTLIERVVPSLIQTGEFNHAFLGVSVAPITPQLAQANGLNTTQGVYIHQVYPDVPANGTLQGSSGFSVVDGPRVPVGGDVIVNIGGQTVDSGEDLSSFLVTEANPGETVSVTVIRDGQRQELEVTLGERPKPTTT